MTAAIALPRPLKGIALIVLATLAFASADVLTKRLAADHPVMVVVAVRYLVNFALLAVFFTLGWGLIFGGSIGGGWCLCAGFVWRWRR